MRSLSMSCAFSPSFSRPRTQLPSSSGAFYGTQNRHDVSLNTRTSVRSLIAFAEAARLYDWTRPVMTSEPICKILKCVRSCSQKQVLRRHLTSQLAEAGIRLRSFASSTSCQTTPPSCVPFGVLCHKGFSLMVIALLQVAGQSRSFVRTELKEEDDNDESAAEDRDSSLDESSMLIITVSLPRNTRSLARPAEAWCSPGCKLQRQEHPPQANRVDHLHGAHWCVIFARLSFRTTSNRRSSAGCFVPAEDALVGLTDRIMTRVSTRESITRVIDLFPLQLSSLDLKLVYSITAGLFSVHDRLAADFVRSLPSSRIEGGRVS